MVVSGSGGNIGAVTARERHRWQPEEDALLRAYARRYGAREWGLLPQRMGRGFLHPRDHKSCQDRWKNYLRPGLKRGSLSPHEQSLLLSLHSHLGNRWKLIAAQLPGRTPKRLGKWWDAFKDRQFKLFHSHKQQYLLLQQHPPLLQEGTQYHHILHTFAQKHVIPSPSSPPPPSLLPPPGLLLMSRRVSSVPSDLSLSAAAGGEGGGASSVPPTPTLSLSTHTSSTAGHAVVGESTSAAALVAPKHQTQLLPPWMSGPRPLSSTTTPSVAFACSAAAGGGGSCSPSVNLSLSPSSSVPRPTSEGGAQRGARVLPLHQAAALAQLCMDLEEGRQAWSQHRKEAAWRLSRLEQQLESEKARKRKEMSEEVEAKIRCLREEAAASLDRVEADYREQLGAIQRDAEVKETKMVESWAARHAKLARLADQAAGASAAAAGPRHFTIAKDLR
uniref:Transcription factor AS1 n=1 Tax=Anthurium amnicola TaxID=1678845 RepID=A0A1D1ZBX7_9ARAE